MYRCALAEAHGLTLCGLIHGRKGTVQYRGDDHGGGDGGGGGGGGDGGHGQHHGELHDSNLGHYKQNTATAAREAQMDTKQETVIEGINKNWVWSVEIG